MAEKLQFVSGNNTLPQYHLPSVDFLPGSFMSWILFHKIYKPTFLGFQFFSESVPYHVSMSFFLKQNTKWNARLLG